MMTNSEKTILVCGATGGQGGATVRHLLRQGFNVRALTRNAEGDGAKALREIGATVVQGDMGDKDSLKAAFDGVQGVFSVQNTQISGVEGEIAQGKNVADLARDSGAHLVYTSAMKGENTGIPHFDSKTQIEAYIESLGIPYTILLPVGFMEVLTEKAFYPAMTAWHLQPRVMGEDAPQSWIAVDDIGAASAAVFADPAAYAGRKIALVGDQKSIGQCRAIYADVMGKKPSSFPFPLWIFERFMAKEVVVMWRWLRDVGYTVDVAQTRAVIPDVMDLRTWLTKKRDGQL
ncbi:MAG: NmrA/HSCARG family protein [Anaerolineaceae bacterium]|nr:MAG: NmrA/HSCARG family protein [Anaerolineaceae bacterium]